MSNLIVIVYVSGGSVLEATVPEGVDLKVVDLDNCQEPREDCLAEALEETQVW